MNTIQIKQTLNMAEIKWKSLTPPKVDNLPDHIRLLGWTKTNQYEDLTDYTPRQLLWWAYTNG